MSDDVQALNLHIAELEAQNRHLEDRRVMAQGKADTYLRELNTLRKARERGKRANRRLRGDVETLQARLYRLTNRG